MYNVINLSGKYRAAMDNSSLSRASLLRFGVFELDCRAGELRKSGVLVHLPHQPFRILALLASHSGQIVTREEIRQEIWGDDTYVDFEQCLNQYVRQIRTALGGDAEIPRYIETLPRRGYRFIYPVTAASVNAASPGETAAADGPREGESHAYKFVALAAGAVMLIMAAVLALNVAGLRNRLLGPATGRLTIRSIAVLPLENLSGDPQQEYFADGMTEELITTLGEISALRVISRTSVLRYKGTQKPLPEIARELNVDAILEGTVLHSGNRVRITANLLYAPGDRHLWARTYERDVGDVLSLQDEVARNIANQVKIKLTPQEQARLASARPVNPEAYRLYLQGRYFFFKRTLPAFDKSIQLFHQALEKDPNSARAYAGLSESYGILPFYDGALPRVAFPKARAAALKALELGNSLAEAHAALGSVLFYYDWDWLAAERELKRAIELKPSYVVAHHWYAEYLTAMGRHEQAFAEIRSAQELDPVSPLLRAVGGTVDYDARHYDESIEQCRKALEFDPNFGPAHRDLAKAYMGKRMFREAMAQFEEADRLIGHHNGMLGQARVHVAAGRRAEAMRLLGRLWQQHKTGEVSTRDLAPLCAALGDKQRALQLAKNAYEQRDPYIVFVNVNPIWDLLRSDPRFQALVRRMNFPPQSGGTRPQP